MKTLILTAALFASQAHAGTTKDGLCLAVGQMAQTIAEARAAGTTEATMKALANETKPAPPMPGGFNATDASRMVIQLVFTMQLSPADARKLVYVKCLAGDFGRM